MIYFLIFLLGLFIGALVGAALTIGYTLIGK